MAAIAKLGDLSKGHAPWPPTPMVQTPITKTYFNGALAGAVDPSCQYASHVSVLFPFPVHPQSTRYPTSGSSKTYIEGYPVARTDDPLADGDFVGPGSPNSFIE
jgi:hypothetical protein